MANYGYWSAALKGLTQKPLETYNTLQMSKLQNMLEEQEYMKNLQRSMQTMDYFNQQQNQGQPQSLALREPLSLSGGQIFGQGGEPRGEYLPGTERFLNTPPKVSTPEENRVKYKLVPSSIGEKGRWSFGVKEDKELPVTKYSQEAKDYELKMFEDKLKLKQKYKQEDDKYGDEYDMYESPYEEYPDAFLENGVWKVIRNGQKYRIED